MILSREPAQSNCPETILVLGDVKELKIADMRKKDNIELRVVKEQVLKSAIERAAKLLRIDDILAAARSTTIGQK